MNEEEQQVEEQVNGASADATASEDVDVEEPVAEDTADGESLADTDVDADSVEDADAPAEDNEAEAEAEAEVQAEAEADLATEDVDAETPENESDSDVEAPVDADSVEDADAPAEDNEAEAEAVVETAQVAVKEEPAQDVTDAADLPEAQDTEQVPDDDRQWYVIHCYSGYENKVRHAIEQRIETMDMQDKIFDVVVPTEEEIEVKDGKRRTVERRVFPGYILVQMLMDEDSWYVVRNTPGVTGFVGMGNQPTPLRPEEVSQIIKRMEAEAPKIKVTFKEGQKIRIIDGPFNDFIGTVAEIDMDKGKVRALVNFFGRDTPVELDFLQVEKA